MKKSSSSLLCLLLLIASCSSSKNPRVLIETSMGNIEVEVYVNEAPFTATNFMQHVDDGMYNGEAAFYRVVRPDNQPNNATKIEVIQGGLYHSELAKNLKPIEHETTQVTGIKHTDGVLSMARTHPGTATTEFFICIGNQPELDYGGARNPDGQGFAAFGKVVKGMDVVKQIQLQQDSSQYLLQPVAIKKVARIE